MRRLFPAFLMAVVAGLGLVAGGKAAVAADNYAFDPVHSSVTFKARHLDISWIHGRFDEIKGNFSLDREHPEKSMFELSITAESVDTGNEGRDRHLRQADFFDAEQFPKIDFKS